MATHNRRYQLEDRRTKRMLLEDASYEDARTFLKQGGWQLSTVGARDQPHHESFWSSLGTADLTEICGVAPSA